MHNGPTFIEQAAAYLENFFLAEWATRPEGLLPEKVGLKKGARGAQKICLKPPCQGEAFPHPHSENLLFLPTLLGVRNPS